MSKPEQTPRRRPVRARDKDQLKKQKLEIQDLNMLVGEERTLLKKMCDLCDKQRADIAHLNADIAHLRSIVMGVKILVRAIDGAKA